MKTNCNIKEYLNYYQKFPNVFNNERHLLMKNIVYPTLALVDSGELYFDEDTYEKCINYVEKRYHTLFPYQKFIYGFVFIYVDKEKSSPYFATFFHMMGRGNGKDGMYSPLMNFLTTHYYGIKNYHIDIVANAEGQAEDTFRIVYDMLDENKALKKFFYWNKVEVINKQTKSRFRFNTSNAKTKDGKKTGAILFNEYHAYENYDQIKIFESGLGKVLHPRTFIMTTDGYVREGPLDDLIRESIKILNGEENYLKIFPFICRIDDYKEAHNPEKWIKANPSIEYMPVLKERIQMDYKKMLGNSHLEAEFYAKRMDRPKGSNEKAISSWENILRCSYDDSVENWQDVKKQRPFPSLDRKNAICGIDFASVNDFATAGFLFKENDEYIWIHHTWICKQSPKFKEIVFPFDMAGQKGFDDFSVIDEPYIREELIVNWIVQEMPKYNVIKVIMDSHRYHVLRRTFEDYGFDEETRNNTNGFIRKIRLAASVYNIVIPQLERDLIQGNINIGLSRMMRWAMNNAYIKHVGQNLSIEKQEAVLRKTDPLMAFVHAYSGKELLENDEIVIYI